MAEAAFTTQHFSSIPRFSFTISRQALASYRQPVTNAPALYFKIL